MAYNSSYYRCVVASGSGGDTLILAAIWRNPWHQNLFFGAQIAFSVVIFCRRTFCLISTSVAYFQIFKIIRRHQRQVQAHASQNFNQQAIDLLKYKNLYTRSCIF